MELGEQYLLGIGIESAKIECLKVLYKSNPKIRICICRLTGCCPGLVEHWMYQPIPPPDPFVWNESPVTPTQFPENPRSDTRQDYPPEDNDDEDQDEEGDEDEDVLEPESTEVPTCHDPDVPSVDQPQVETPISWADETETTEKATQDSGAEDYVTTVVGGWPDEKPDDYYVNTSTWGGSEHRTYGNQGNRDNGGYNDSRRFGGRRGGPDHQTYGDQDYHANGGYHDPNRSSGRRGGYRSNQGQYFHQDYQVDRAEFRADRGNRGGNCGGNHGGNRGGNRGGNHGGSMGRGHSEGDC